MLQKRITGRVGFLSVLLLFMAIGSGRLLAQGALILSKHSDFSTEDRVFTANDSMFMMVVAPHINYTDIDENEFELKADSGGDEFEGHFTNLLNGTYVAAIDLGTADPAENRWSWEAGIKDNHGNEFEVEVDIVIGDGENVEDDFEISGTIEALNEPDLTVNGLTISANENTKFANKNGELIEFASLQVGDFVEIKAFENAEGALIALRIKVEDQGGEDIEVKGEIQALGADSLVVLAHTFFVDAQTEIFDDNGNSITLADLQVGFFVEIRAVHQADGTLLATKLKVEDESHEQEIEFTGEITFLGDEVIVVVATEFLVTGETKILDNDEQPVLFSQLELGMIVEIRGVPGADSLLRATRIKIEDRLGEDEIEITGEVTDIAEQALVVAGLTFQINAQTVFLNDNRQPIQLADIRVGFIVEVRANRLGNGDLLATRVKIEDRANDELEITGAIEQLLTHGLVVAGFEFTVTDLTQILNDENEPIEFAHLQVGMVVEIRAEIAEGDSLFATKIKVEDHDGDKDEVELTGTIDAITGESLVVAGLTFFVNAQTAIMDHAKNLISFADLKLGLIVEVRGVLQADGSLLATRIKLEDRIEDEIEITGSIEQVSDLAITVLGKIFGLTENTVVLDGNKQVISLSELFVGMTVEVRGDLLPDGTLIAIRIKIEDGNADEIEVVGPIESFGQNTVEVIGVVFFVTDSTAILDKENNPIAFADLQIGQTVEVKALVRSDGSRVATRIKVEDLLLMSAVVNQVDGNGIAILNREILFDSNTLILGKMNELLATADLTIGQIVEVRARQGSGQTLIASKVKIQGTANVTSINAALGEKGTAPDDFVLLQNYPNPFNPSTTISFRIPDSGSALVQTKVSVFNLLGQEVRTLINSNMSPGLYRVQWDGKDGRGVSLASGVYVYRLQAGPINKTQRMLLVK